MKLLLSFIAGGLLAITLCLFFHDCPVTVVEKIVYKEAVMPEPKLKPLDPALVEWWCCLLYEIMMRESNGRHAGFFGSADERGLCQLRLGAWTDGCKKLRVRWNYMRVWEREASFKILMGYLFWIQDRLINNKYRTNHMVEGMLKGYNGGVYKYMGFKPVTRRWIRRTSDYHQDVSSNHRRQLNKPTWKNHREAKRIKRAVEWALRRI